MTMHLDHIAVLVRNIEAANATFALDAALLGPIETFASEGTREQYVGTDERTARLLLMEPINADGPYGRAMHRRGPGLHHLAFNVQNLAAFIDTLSGSGWYLLPQSLRTIAAYQTAWLGRPVVPTLLEVHQRELKIGAPIVTTVELPVAGRTQLISRLKPDDKTIIGLSSSPDAHVWLTIAGHRHRIV